MSERQLPLRFLHTPSLTGDDFLVTAANAEAIAWIDRWPVWPAPAVLVYGPAGGGKTHLCAVFAERTRARSVGVADLDPLRLHDVVRTAPALILDDADRAVEGRGERPLLHLYNLVAEAGKRLLLTAETAPCTWPLQLGDLRSRLNSCPAVAIGPPDDALLAALLVKLFADRQLQVSAMVVDYLVARMERSFDAARRLVARIDDMALSRGSAPTLAVARAVLAAEGKGERRD
jgi:chromosomal replication initiation ATPase DnaA